MDQEDVEPHVSGVRLLADGYVSETFLIEKIDPVYGVYPTWGMTRLTLSPG